MSKVNIDKRERMGKGKKGIFGGFGKRPRGLWSFSSNHMGGRVYLEKPL
jgi:hypothetical protein